MEKKVSIIIPTKNCAADLERCLEALKKQTYKNTELIIVDGHSTDGTDELAKRYGARVFYEERGTRAFACNIALDNAKGDLLAFTDADCIPPPNWLEVLISNLSIKGDQFVSIGGPNTTPGDVSYVGKCVDLTYGSQIMTGETRYGRIYDGVIEVDHNPGCNVIYRKDIIDKLKHRYEEDLVTAEDVVFDYGLVEAGYRILFVEDALMWHRRRDTVKAYAKQVYRYAWGRAMANRRHKGLEHWTHMAPSLLLFAVAIFASLIFMLNIFTGIGFHSTATRLMNNALLIMFSMVFITYWSVSLVGAFESYSPYRRIRYLAAVPLFMAIGHIMWGLGYLKGMRVKMDGL